MVDGHTGVLPLMGTAVKLLVFQCGSEFKTQEFKSHFTRLPKLHQQGNDHFVGPNSLEFAKIAQSYDFINKT
ncbi:MAG: hypothetical protein Q8830_04125, partial [Candidatus Phytoplasma australasiaticum]|nr:hypothetical protein [Candidatus Phytoplasma australasiaticum]